MPTIPLTPNTHRLIELCFSPEDQPAVAALLETRCGSGLPLMREATPEALERLRFAVLKLGEGSLAKLTRAIEVANEDWRDVLVAAGFGHSVTAHQVWFEERSRA